MQDIQITLKKILRVLEGFQVDIDALRLKVRHLDANLDQLMQSQKRSRSDIAAMHDRCTKTCAVFLEMGEDKLSQKADESDTLLQEAKESLELIRGEEKDS